MTLTKEEKDSHDDDIYRHVRMIMKNSRGEQHDKRRDPSLQALSLVEFGRLGQAPDKRE